MKNNLKSILILVIFCIMISGCAKADDTPTVVVDSEESVISYSLETASYDDVVLTKKLSCYYNKTNDEEIAFDVTGRLVDKVYVRKGDEVKKGDLLCELNYDSLSEDIENLTYSIKKNELLLEYTYNDEALDIQDCWIPTISNPYIDTEAIKENVKSIQENYDRKRQLLNDSLEFDNERLEKKKQELKASRIYASIDGKIYKIKNDLEGSTSKAGTVIITIAGNGEGIFEVNNSDDADLFLDGEIYDLKVTTSGAAGDYTVTPYERDSWKDTLKFSIVSTPEVAALEVGASGILTSIVDKKEHVLCVPSLVVHIAGDDAFVYTLDEDNNRVIRYIQIGLVGDDKVEVISGLEEGEKVIRK